MSRPLFSLIRAVLVSLILVTGATALSQPMGVTLRVLTWNVHNTALLGRTPDDRIMAAINFGAPNGVHLMLLQEVPLTLFRNNVRLNNIINAATAVGYNILYIESEYPARSFAPASNTSTGYMYIYDPTRLNPVTLNNQAVSIIFSHANFFRQGFAQGRPPVSMIFNVNRPNGTTFRLNVLNWHNEAGGMALGRLLQLESDLIRLLEIQRLNPAAQLPQDRDGRNPNNDPEEWLLGADINAEDTVQSLQNLGGIFHLLSHGGNAIDHFLSPASMNDVFGTPPPPPAPNPIDPLLRSSGRHLALIADVNY